MSGIRCIGLGLVVLLAAATPRAGAATPTSPLTYQLSAKESSCTYAMEHPMHSWTGTSHQLSGAAVVDGSGRTATIRVQTPVLSFDSGNSNRDSHMAETVESYIYGDVSFTGSAVRADSVVAVGADLSGAWQTKGDLTFHGVTRQIQVPVNVTAGPGQLQIRGNFAIRLTDYGIELPSLLGISVKDEAAFTLDLLARSDAAPAK
jgi:polyisoprenoid-binding protein YceI